DARRHRPRRRGRPLRQHDLRHPEWRLAVRITGDPGARLATRHTRPDVLARGGATVVASSGCASPNDTLTRPRPARGRALAGLGDPRRRPAGAVGPARLPPSPRTGTEPAG